MDTDISQKVIASASALKLDVAGSTTTSVTTCKCTWCHNPEDNSFNVLTTVFGSYSGIELRSTSEV
jgi:hypothetical protein